MACLVGAAFVRPDDAKPSERQTANRAAHGYLVRIHKDTDLVDPRERSLAVADRARRLSAGARSEAARHLLGDWYFVPADGPAGSTRSDELGVRLRTLPMVRDVAPNAQEPRAAVPNDTLFASEQWWLRAYDAGTSGGVAGLPAAWDRSTGQPASGSGPIVAVLDSGITSHPDLDAHLVGPGYDFVSKPEYANDGDGRDNDPTDPGDALPKTLHDADLGLWDGCAVSEASTWHGTFIGGQIAAVSNNGAGVAGINWVGRVLPVRVGGRCGAAIADLVDGMRWAAGLDVAGVPHNQNKANIIVIGFAGFEPCDTANPNKDVAAAAQLYIDTLAELRAQGVFVVAAAGNERTSVGRPASCTGAFAVTSLNRLGFKANYANWGPQVALATVGGDASRGASCDTQLADSGLVSTYNAGTTAAGAFAYGAGSGTSFAAPAVAGVASLMLAVNPSLTVGDLERGLKASARPHATVAALGPCDAAKNAGRCQCTTATCGAGILDAEQALAFAADPGGYTAPQRNPISLDSSAIRQCAVALGLAPLPPEPVASQPPSGGSSSGGGGALSAGWLMGLLLAVWFVARSRPRQGSR